MNFDERDTAYRGDKTAVREVQFLRQAPFSILVKVEMTGLHEVQQLGQGGAQQPTRAQPVRFPLLLF